MVSRVGILSLLMTIWVPRPSSAQDPPDTLRLTLTVEVMDQFTQRPVQNVVIRLPQLSTHVLTDEAGRAVLENMVPGTYRMTLTRMGYRPEDGDFQVFRAGSTQVRLTPMEVTQDAVPGRVLGRVYSSESGDAIEGATVSLVGTALRRETNSIGLFEFQEAPAGRHVLRVSHLGMTSREDSVFIPEDRLLEVEVLLSIDPIPLAGFTVRAHSKWLLASGFFHRQEPGYDGRQWHSTQLEELNPEILRDVLETVPWVNQAGLSGYVSRGRCKMTVFVDGFEMDPWYDLDMIKPDRVEGMEVFYGRGTTMPIEFGRYCGVILIWLKH